MPLPENNSSTVLLDIKSIDFLSVLNQMDDGVIIADINGTILFYNYA